MPTPRAAVHRDLEQRFRDIEGKLRALTGAAGSRDVLTVSSGDFKVDGGNFQLLDVDGSVLFTAGEQPQGDRGVSVFRDDGTPALTVSKGGPSLPQSLVIQDAHGNTIVSEWVFGDGLARPRIAMPGYLVTAPTRYATYGPEVDVTAGTYVDLWTVDTIRQNALYHPVVALKCSDATTAGDVRWINAATGTALTDFFTGAWLGSAPAGTTAYTDAAGNLVLPGSYDQRIRVTLQARRTAGAGALTVALPVSIGA